MSRITHVASTLAAAFVLVFVAQGVRESATAQARPNILLIVTDDMGYGDIGLHDSPDIPTPNIDALMRSGTRFTDGYVSGPFCSPTRAGLMTGKYPQRFGHEFNVGVGPAAAEHGLPTSETTIADRLKAAGYRTALFGKWHLGSSDKFHPQSRGFDEFFGFLGGQHSYTETQSDGANPLLDGRKPAENLSYLTDELGDRAAEFIRRKSAAPFLVYLAFNAVHVPMQAPEKYLARFPKIADAQRRTYAAMLSAMDDAVGRVMVALRSQGLEERTLVVFFNDNGGPTMAGTTINGSRNTPLRGSKRQTWEGGIRVPFAFSWKGSIPAGRVDRRPIIQLDVFPTALAAAGVTVQPSWQLDGVNLLPWLTGGAAGRPHDVLYWRLGNHMAIRSGDWKLLRTSEGPLQVGTFDALASLAGAELYNLATDIGETKNLAASEPVRARELAQMWLRWNQQLLKPSWGPGRGGGMIDDQKHDIHVPTRSVRF
jgi:arylsulfatase A-like enzyme